MMRESEIRVKAKNELKQKCPTYEELLDSATDLLFVIRALEEATKSIRYGDE